nr:4-hydroxy-2-oxoglutarate aldolase [Streptococcus thermophilus]
MADVHTVGCMLFDADLSNVRVNDPWKRYDLSTLNRLHDAEAAVVGDTLGHLTTMAGRIRRMTGEGSAIGNAFPINCTPGDNLGVWRALDDAQPGDIFVINARGADGSAIIGGQIARMMVEAGVLGCVVDGPVRDVNDLEEYGLQVFATGTTPMGPTRFGPAEVGYPVACAGTVVKGGDLIIADNDGVTVVPAGRIQEVLDNIADSEKKEKDFFRKISEEWVPAKRRGDVGQDNPGTVTPETEEEVDEER